MQYTLQLCGVSSLAILALAGCATKGFVKETVGQQRVEVDQRIDSVEGQVNQGSQRLGAVETQVGEQGRRVEAVGSRVGGLETSVGQASSMAKSADERATGAMARADEVDSRLTRLWKNRNTRSLVEKLDVRFAFNKADLNDGAQTALLNLVKEMRENPGLAVELEGYTDPVGPPEYNMALSQRRVEAVRRFLVLQGIEQARIHAIGLGAITEAGLPADQKRRVTVKLIALAE